MSKEWTATAAAFDEKGRSRDDAWTRSQQPVLSVAAVLIVLAAAAALCFLSGGFIFQRTAPVVFALAACAVVAVWRGHGLVRPSRPYLIGLAAFAAFVAWTGLSVLWSAGPDLSWLAFDVACLYLLVAAVAGALPGRPLQLRLAAHGFALVTLVVAAYAFTGKITPGVLTDPHGVARLSAPVGYWNVLAGLIVMAVPVFVVTASRRGAPRWLRGLSSSALVLLLVTFFFTFSRGGYVAAAAALLVFFLLTTRRLAALASLAVPAGLVAAVLFHLRGLHALFSASGDHALLTSQGHTLAVWCALALAAAFVLQVLLALAEERWPLSSRQARAAGVAVLVVVVSVSLLGALVYQRGHHDAVQRLADAYHAALSPSGPRNDADRLTSLASSGRLGWYREAIRAFGHHPVAGTGAGTFTFTNELYRTNTLVVHHSHDQWLNVASELGLVGLVLFAVAVGGLVWAAFGRLLADRRDPYRALLAACQAASVGFLVHISLDWDWDMAAITLAFLLLTGAAAAYVRDRDMVARGLPAAPPAAPTPPAARLGARVLVTALLVFLVVSWALPFLAQRATAAARDSASRGRVAAAESQARRAHALDPLSVEPLLALAAVQAQAGRAAAAQQTLYEAMRLQPDNYQPYYQMGTLRLRSFGDKAGARLWYERALRLNPMDPATRHMLAGL